MCVDVTVTIQLLCLCHQTERQDVETGVIRTPQRRLLYTFFSRIFIQSFTLTFLAEWGDRSQITTIILAAREVSVMLSLGQGAMSTDYCVY